MFAIKIKYETGDSFNSYEEMDLVGHVWKNLDKAKESLERIKNHYEYVKEYNFFNKPKRRTRLPKGLKWDYYYKIIRLILVDDDGNEFKASAFWTGYFEHLLEAKIIFHISDNESNEFVYRPGLM